MRTKVKKKFDLFMDIAKRINTSIDLNETLSLIMSGAKQLMNAEASSLMLINKEKNELFFHITTGEKGDILKEVKIPINKGIAGLVATSGESLIVNQAESDPRLYRHVDQLTKIITRNLICVPLIVEDQIIGVLEVLNKIPPDEFSPDDLETLKSFSEFAALAVHQRNLYQQMENKAYETTVLYRLSEAINRWDTLDDLLQENIRIVCEAFQSSRVSIIAREGEAFIIKAATGIPPHVLKNKRIPIQGNVLEYMLRNQTGVLSPNIHEDKRFNGKSSNHYKSASFVATPLKLKNKIVAFLCVTERQQKMPYQQSDLHLLEMIAQQIMENYSHSHLTEEFRKKQKMEAELAVTAQMQQDILPRDFSSDGQLDVAACTIPAKVVGGDFYDYLPLGQGRFGIVIADVAGKGVTAGLFMAISRSMIRVHFAHTQSPATILELANLHIFNDSRSGMFVTCFCAILDTGKREIVYANAGHYAQYLLRSRDRKIISLYTQGKPLGIFPKERFKEKKVRYEPGDVLVLFTDGVTEAVNAKYEEYGQRRLKARIRNLQQDRSEAIRAQIIDDLRKHQGGAESLDDITLMVITLGKGQKKTGVKLRLASQLTYVSTLLNEAQRLLTAVNADREDISDVLVALDEAFANIVHHGYKSRTDGIIDIEISVENGGFTVIFTDEAATVMPALRPPAKGKALTAKKRSLGIGRYLMSNLMDDVRYERTKNRNRLTLIKKISSGGTDGAAG